MRINVACWRFFRFFFYIFYFALFTLKIPLDTYSTILYLLLWYPKSHVSRHYDCFLINPFIGLLRNVVSCRVLSLCLDLNPCLFSGTVWWWLRQRRGAQPGRGGGFQRSCWFEGRHQIRLDQGRAGEFLAAIHFLLYCRMRCFFVFFPLNVRALLIWFSRQIVL